MNPVNILIRFVSLIFVLGVATGPAVAQNPFSVQTIDPSQLVVRQHDPCDKDRSGQVSLWERVFCKKPKRGDIIIIPTCPHAYSAPEVVARYSSSPRRGGSSSLTVDQNGNVYFIDDAERIARVPADGWEPIDLSAYHVTGAGMYGSSLLHKANSFYFIGHVDGDAPYHDKLYRYDRETGLATALLDSEPLGGFEESGYYWWLWDFAIHAGHLYFEHEDSSASSETGVKIRKISLSSLPALVDDATIIKDGGISWMQRITAGSAGAYYFSSVDRVNHNPNAVRVVDDEGRDTPVLGDGSLTPLPGEAPVEALLVETSNIHGGLALNRCGDIVVSDNIGSIFMKPRGSSDAFSIYHVGSLDRGPNRPYALVFDSGDNLYAVMCQGPSPITGPCEVVKFPPSRGPERRSD